MSPWKGVNLHKQESSMSDGRPTPRRLLEIVAARSLAQVWDRGSAALILQPVAAHRERGSEYELYEKGVRGLLGV